jgi:8-oxo-dGTP pyrophosphatase MutT (NUDIX family)
VRDPKSCAPGRRREVVAAILTHGGRVGLFRRSVHVSGDVGCWHCITGYLPGGADPLRHALLEIEEETGIVQSELDLATRALMELHSADGSRWRVHAFHFHSATDVVSLNWEHDGCCWVLPDQIDGLATVNWLDQVLDGLVLAPSGLK